jgi:CRISPR/Cas system-associated exonuclease Cas4 (RecB family)
MSIITKIIEEFLNSPRQRDNYLSMKIHIDEDDNRKFRVSDAGRCRLYRYWKRQGKDQPAKETHLLQIMEMGNLIHAWLEYALDSKGILHNAEIIVSDEHRKGHADALVYVNGHIALYDFKTIGSKQAWYMLNNGAKAKREHQYQVLSYMDMINTAQTSEIIDVKEARIAYITREEVSSKYDDKIPPLHVIADVAADLDLLPAVKTDWQALIRAWEEQQEPQANPQAWKCKYCPYHGTCEKNFN